MRNPEQGWSCWDDFVALVNDAFSHGIVHVHLAKHHAWLLTTQVVHRRAYKEDRFDSPDWVPNEADLEIAARWVLGFVAGEARPDAPYAIGAVGPHRKQGRGKRFSDAANAHKPGNACADNWVARHREECEREVAFELYMFVNPSPLDEEDWRGR